MRKSSSSNRPSSAGTGDRLSVRLLGVAKISCGAHQCWNRDSPDWLVTPSVSAASQPDTLMHPLPGRRLMLDGPARSGKVLESFQPQTGKQSSPFANRHFGDLESRAICWLDCRAAAASTMRLGRCTTSLCKCAKED